jgi:glycosyltransferase involved in cell wall biosynthesis
MARQSYIDAGAPSDRVSAVPLGVDTSAFSIPRTFPEVPPIRFVFVGQFDDRKGADILLGAVALLEKQTKNFRLAVVGNRGEADATTNSDLIEYRGWLPHAELGSELAKHHVLVLPSRHDSFGMVVAEAMACGLPAIVSESVGAQEMVTPSVNGLIVPAGESPALAETMGWFVANSHLLPEMRVAARRTAEAYSWDVYAERVVERLTVVATNRVSIDHALAATVTV